ncbi:hypothetical protein BH20ACI3_BH20ACI3_32670 [soil metagenome]
MTLQRYVAVQEEVVDAASSADYERWIKHLVRTRYENPSGRGTWQAGKHNQSYYYVFPIDSLNDVGLESRFQLWFQGVSETHSQEAAQVAALPISGVRSTRLSVLERMEKYSYSPSTSVVRAPMFAFVDVHQVRADMQDQYDALVTSLVEAMRKVEYPFAWSAFRTIIGEGRTFYGPPRTYHYVVFFESMYQFFEEHWFGAAMGKALGTEGARQYSDTEKKCLQGFENFTCKLRSDLSYSPPQ